MFIRYRQSHPSDRGQFDGFLKNKIPRGYSAIVLSLRVRIGTIYSL